MSAADTARLPSGDLRVVRPLYTVSEAARYLHLPVSTLYDWAKPPAGESLITVVPTPGHSHHPSIPFVGFAEAFVIHAAKHAGVPDHRIRPNIESIKRTYPSIEYALAYRRIATDGAELLVKMDDDDDLDVPRLGQKQFTDTVRDQLRFIEYGQDGFARRLTLWGYGKIPVTVDPYVASGRPLVHGTRVKDLVDRYRSGDTPKQIAKAFDLPVGTVKTLVNA
jgi:uncharacterized protein (DUF433 family)